MLTQAPPIFKTNLRQAEQSDARLEIRREDKQGQRGQQDHAEEEADDNALWEDSNSVSVEALKAFLIGFLQEKGDITPVTAGYTLPHLDHTPDSLPVLKPASPLAAKAMRAYAATAGQHHETAMPEPSAPSIPADTQSEDLASLLQSDEIRTIHLLIRELNLLEAHNIQTLTILKADTFLEALVLAVTLQKQQLSL